MTSVLSRPRDTVSEAIQRFWELEEIGTQPPMSREDEQCEQHFQATHSRDHTGRYVLRLPLKEGNVILGPSRQAAVDFQLSSERRLEQIPDLQTSYMSFMEEYLRLGHMETLPKHAAAPFDSYFLPHHAVVKANDPSGKLRVVFNASCSVLLFIEALLIPKR